jgi:prepilin-type N-terminal cleavage/methylation domain-containing protein/prepilin-type processing-associated H-X9-DG protein
MKTSHSLLRVRLFRIGLEACRADFSAGARPGSSRRRAQARKVAHIVTQTGFTLIEVLVVIVSVAILGAIVFSATKSASRSAKSVKAVSNLKQIGVMVTSYAGDNNNRIPCYIDWDAYFGSPPGLVFFQRTLAEYAGYQYDYSSMRPLPECFYDPSIDGNPLPQHPMGAFGVNAAILPRADECLSRFGSSLGVPVTRISRPNVKVICCSAVEVGWSSSWFIDGETFAENGYNPTSGPQPRNAGGAASLFADGHVEKLNVANMDQATRRRYFLPDP